jgi:hypothetical protein
MARNLQTLYGQAALCVLVVTNIDLLADGAARFFPPEVDHGFS